MKLIKDLGIIKMKDSEKSAHRGLFECGECNTQMIRRFRGVGKICQDCSRKLTPKRHGMTGTKIHRLWLAMIGRTTSKNSNRYEFYKDKKPYERWLKFENFYEDMNSTYYDGATLDRKDNNLPYSKDNCRWTNKNVQAQNTRRIRKTNTSGYRGVSRNKKLNKWQAGIQANGTAKYLGIFDYPWTAAYAYDSYVIMNHLEHTKNFAEVS